MILKSNPNSVESSGISESKDILIKQSHHIIEFATSRIYDNIIRAVIRELSTNAYDSHVEAGCPEVPFKVVLPTTNYLEFTVRDYGIGMDHDTVMNLFSTLFESSKNNSNDFNGCFGIGSKAPIAYSPMYTVIAYDGEGKKRTYAVIKDDNVLKCNYMGEFEAEGEPRGLEVSVPVKKADVGTFTTEARNYVYPFFVTYPKIEGYETFEHIVKDYEEFRETGFRYSDNETFKTTFVAVMGNTPYPLDINLLEEQGILEHVTDYRSGTVYLHFDIGELTINPGRERLNYSVTNNTLNAIKEKLQAVKEDIEDFFEKKFAKVDWFEATYNFNQNWRNSVRYKAYVRIVSKDWKLNYRQLDNSQIEGAGYSRHDRWMPAKTSVVGIPILSHDIKDAKPWYDRNTGILHSSVNILPGLRFVSISAEWRDDLRKVKRIINASFSDHQARPKKGRTVIYYVYEEYLTEFCDLYNVNPDNVYSVDDLSKNMKKTVRVPRPPNPYAKSKDEFSAFRQGMYNFERSTYKFSDYSMNNPIIFFVQPRLGVIKIGEKYNSWKTSQLTQLALNTYGFDVSTVLYVTETTAAKLRKLPYAYDASAELIGRLRKHKLHHMWIRHGAFANVSRFNKLAPLVEAKTDCIPNSKLKFILTKIKALQPRPFTSTPAIFLSLFYDDVKEYEETVKRQIKRLEAKYNKQVAKIPHPIQHVFKFISNEYKEHYAEIIARQLLAMYLQHHKSTLQKTKAERKEEYEKIVQAKKINSILNGSCKLAVQETGSAFSKEEDQTVAV